MGIVMDKKPKLLSIKEIFDRQSEGAALPAFDKLTKEEQLNIACIELAKARLASDHPEEQGYDQSKNSEDDLINEIFFEFELDKDPLIANINSVLDFYEKQLPGFKKADDILFDDNFKTVEEFNKLMSSSVPEYAEALYKEYKALPLEDRQKKPGSDRDFPDFNPFK